MSAPPPKPQRASTSTKNRTTRSPSPYRSRAEQTPAEFVNEFWQHTINVAENTEDDFKHQALPLARIKKVMKSDPEVRMISSEVTVLFEKACQIFIQELTARSHLVSLASRRRTLSRPDVAQAVSKSDMFDFLIDIIPREDATGWEGGDGGPSAGGSNGAKNGGNGKGKGKAGKGGRKRKTSVDEEDEEGNGEGGSEVAGSVQSDEHGEAGPSKRARRTATKQEYEEEVLNGGVDEGINLQLGGAPAPLPMTTTAEHQEYLLEQYRQQQAGVQPTPFASQAATLGWGGAGVPYGYSLDANGQPFYPPAGAPGV